MIIWGNEHKNILTKAPYLFDSEYLSKMTNLNQCLNGISQIDLRKHDIINLFSVKFKCLVFSEHKNHFKRFKNVYLIEQWYFRFSEHLFDAWIWNNCSILFKDVQIFQKRPELKKKCYFQQVWFSLNNFSMITFDSIYLTELNQENYLLFAFYIKNHQLNQKTAIFD
jgi:hypothetical protein